MVNKLLLGIVVLLNSGTIIASQPIISYTAIQQPVIGRHGMVATQEAIASQVGLEILQQGGNAIDAAVAVGYALAVTLPRAGNLGGGGFMMLRLASGNVIAIDYRETAPHSSHAAMFLNADGSVNRDASQKSVLGSGVPGTVAGLEHALNKYGSLPRAVVMAPAIKLAKKGFIVSDDLHSSLTRAASNMQHYPASAAIFLANNGAPPAVGTTLIQSDLARSLQLIADRGSDAFYKGPIAAKLVAYMGQNGGRISSQDLARYTVKERQPVSGTYRGYTIHAMPPPSSGGVILIEMLNMLEHYPLSQWGWNSAISIHHMVEVMRRAYADRSKWLGDPDFHPIPTQQLTHKAFAKKRAATIRKHRATPSKRVHPAPIDVESTETTHYSIVDKWGNAVSNTYTLNFSYGNKQVIPGTGILLNNEMDDFSSKPGVPNAYGLIGGKYNAVAPNKRMLSSMTPTIVTSGNALVLVTGSPGGSRIITTTLQLILNVVDHNMNIAQASAAPRVHHQWWPNEIRVEQFGISPDTRRLLEKRGHSISEKWAMGSTQSIHKKEGILYGASDPRKPGAATLAY